MAASGGSVPSSARDDGRDAYELRPIKCERGILNRADGSVRYCQGHSCVMVAVNGPMRVRQKEEIIDRATIDVVFKPASGQQTPRHSYYETVIQQTMEYMILTQAHPCTKIAIVIQTIEEDGSMLACSINAACMAVIDAGVQSRCMLSAVSMSMAPREGVVLLDPDAREEKQSGTTATFAICNKTQAFVLTNLNGRVSRKLYSQCMKLALKASKQRVEPFKTKFFDTVFLGAEFAASRDKKDAKDSTK